MRITFYDTRIENRKTILVKEKAVNYQAESDINVRSPEIVKDLMNALVRLNALGEEHLYMLGLNCSSKLLGVFCISKGTVNQTCLSPREIFIRALMVGASSIVICHNHPSGNATPSRADVIATQKLKEAGELIDIPLLDHIVIGDDNYFSFMDKGLL